MQQSKNNSRSVSENIHADDSQNSMPTEVSNKDFFNVKTSRKISLGEIS